MKAFLGEDFLLQTRTAGILYRDYASRMPLYDFHCHLSPKEIYEDKPYTSLTEAWLATDHYKWRLLREMGVSEDYITGGRTAKEKFLKFAEMMPYALGNPMYHWTHLELRRFFGIDLQLNPDNAETIWERANAQLPTLTPRQILLRSHVHTLNTTDDPTDELTYHRLLAADASFPVRVRPTFRPDKLLAIDRPTFAPWIAKLQELTHVSIRTLADFEHALEQRLAYFAEQGCLCADHSLEEVAYLETDRAEADRILQKTLAGIPPTPQEVIAYKTYLLRFLGQAYHARGWVQQYHIGAMRNVSSRCFAALGPDSGYDCISDRHFAPELSQLLDALDRTDQLPKTILYCLNPGANEILAALKNGFSAPGVAAKVQFGSAWWFNDQKDGIERQLEALAQMGLLSRFVGMLTDSRSLLSYVRHEYFRRILCNKVGRLLEEGEYPYDLPFVGQIIEDICFNNAFRYFECTPKLTKEEEKI
ncbi:MAG: glucuronate isomerase [Eubacteriales bacterium]